MTNHFIHPFVTCCGKTVMICEENIMSPKLDEKISKPSDLALYGHKFDLIYFQWNTRGPGAVYNITSLSCQNLVSLEFS